MNEERYKVTDEGRYFTDTKNDGLFDLYDAIEFLNNYEMNANIFRKHVAEERRFFKDIIYKQQKQITVLQDTLLEERILKNMANRCIECRAENGYCMKEAKENGIRFSLECPLIDMEIDK